MLSRSPNPKTPPTQCQRMLRGMEAMLRRVETLEKDHNKIKWSHAIAISLFIFIATYIVYDGMIGNYNVHINASSVNESIVTRQYIYDDQGRIEAQLEFNLDNEVVWKRLYQYDENGNQTRCEDSNREGVAVSRVECTFDEQGREIERTEIDLLEKQSEQWRFTYNEKGAKIRAQKNINSPSTG
ncbi:MAG: hypothetical protein P9L94_01170 [Candidatus Hinthialibacter antarcticus]|nr:hypothetical protein [Candidatus Hinthialibacter antarcticus]